MTKGKTTRNLIIIFIILILAGVVSCFGFQFFTKTGVFYVPGEITYDESLSDEVKDLLSTKLAEVELRKNINISLYRAETISSDDLLYNIYVPVTDFYNPTSSVTSAELTAGIADGEIELIPIPELNNQVKLLAIDDHYYLDTFDSGAYFDYLKVSGDNTDDIQKVKDLVTELLPTFPNKDTVLTFVQTGVTALSRGMNAKLDAIGGDGSYFAANIGDFLSSFDLTHTSNEASFADNAPSAKGSMQICARPAMIDTLTAIGLDIVELTGNHNQDCGNEAALDTIEQYQALGIKTVGGGVSAVAAAEPLLLEEKGTNITMLGYNLSTGGYTLDDTPGANFYTAEKATADIAAAKARGDFIIVDVQYYECSGYASETEDTTCDYANSSAGDQIGFFRELVDMGADIVVGTAAHQPQTYELYGDGVIYYGLGNLFFDQIWWPGTTRSLILAHYFYDGKLLQTRLIPTVYDETMQTKLMDTAAAEAFIDRLNQVRPTQP